MKEYRRGFVFYFLLSCLAAGRIEAEDTLIQTAQATVVSKQPMAAAGPLQGKISLDLRNIDAVDAIKFLAMKAGLNIVVTKSVAGRVSLTVENVNVKDVFDIMLRLNNLAYDTKGDIYSIMTEDEYRVLYGKKFSDTRHVKVFRLNYAIPEQAFNLLDAVKSGIGRLLVDAESGTVMMMDTQEKIEEAEGILGNLEQKNTVKIIGLKYAKAKDVEEQLKAQLDIKKVGTIKSDERTNQIIVQTLPERMKNIEELVKGLDKKTRAVLVDTKILKIKFTNQLDSGIEWEGLFSLAQTHGLTYLGSYPFSLIQKSTAAWQSRQQVLSSLGDSVGSYPFSGTAVDSVVGSKVKPGEAMHVGVINGKRDFDVLIKYLQTFGKTKILANPTLTVVDNHEAKVHVGERRAYVTTTTTAGTTTKTTAEEVTYVDIGVQLTITPTINEDGYVTMKVKPEISSVIGNVESSEGNLIPIIDTTTAETMVMTKDGSTVIIGGLGKEEKSESSRQVPVLGDIPFLGNLFRSKTQLTERTELLILLTPIIYDGDKLITPQDKDSEKFGVKEFKKFDVFKKEYPIEIPEPIKPMRQDASSDNQPEESPEEGKEDGGLNQAVTIKENDGEAASGHLVPKGLKVYGLDEVKVDHISSEALVAAQDTNDAIPQDLSLKGFRAYSDPR
ncbi:MAG: hypothetical protein A2Y00_07470 [Omnitrophica WOR_2 bacterium GWF2_43_52]|nr:MAG: hypothetical protein A2Y00_07470 [Omnitrophica WOR_2 bacterium GWF2_43_52]OGX24998.1 MAG: hypothetical protein A3J51_00850 [Omnitrophica WOR_2 bacterium RIFCSPHIGHO2_02_FULL_45_21]OGX55290.1 MAG: hypothetical protein A2460_07570 [Omnitrophica WOR_2 bacterium RIFOXYC2_FULL_43_9]HAH20721.1 hypothetical protein [Candidatus Omnitrophota bacterium]HBG63589.1 hypothetical protein [Candidatus Omnitrophota bacterium]